MKPIHFGTEGWRAVLAEDYTFARVRAVARAAGEWFGRQSASGPVAVGHDTRFMGDRFASATADELAAHGLEVHLCEGPLPTPAVGYYVVANDLAGAVVLTASHNPAEYNGFKVKGPGGASLPEEGASWIEAEANRILSEEPNTPAPAIRHHRFDVRDAYLDRVLSMVDCELIAKARLSVVADMMHGSGVGYFDEALRRAGCADVRAVRGDPDPTFEWKHPEPIGPNLTESTEMTKDPAVAIGLATDGDADRFGMMARGEYVDIQRAIVFILYHLLENRGWRGRVVRAINVTSMVDRLCEHYGCAVQEASVGFKNIAPEMVGENSDVILGVEESGGFGIKGHVPDRDGSLTALMACELIAHEGKPVEQILSDIFALTGGRSFFDRLDLRLTPDQAKRLREGMPSLAPDSIGGQPVVEVNRLDGAKYIRQNGSWLLLRLSGTEPLVRIYAEAPSDTEVARVLEAGRDLAVGLAGG